jgi:hypothetical protein
MKLLIIIFISKRSYMLSNANVTNRLFTLLRVVFFWFCCMAVLASVGPLVKSLPKQWSYLLLVTIASVVTLGLTIIFVRWEKLQLKDVGVVPNRQSLSRVYIGFITGLLLPCLQAALVLLTGHIKLVISPDITFTAVLLTFLLYLMLSCREELAFRAYPLRSLNYVLGPWGAVLIVAIIFGIEHKVGGSSWIDSFLGAGVGSLLFGLAALRTKGLAFPIGIHAAWNFGQWALGFKGEPGIWKVVIDKEYKDRVDVIGFISYLIVMGLGIVAVYYYWKSSPLQDSVIKFEGQIDNSILIPDESKQSTQHEVGKSWAE